MFKNILNFLQKNKVISFYALAWLVFAALSVSAYPQIFASKCYFNTSWLRCDSSLTTTSKIWIFLLISISTWFFIYVGRKLWLDFAANKEIKYCWFAPILVVLAALVVPFGSSDTNYYFYAGKVASEGLNPYVQSWEMEKPFAYNFPRETITSFSYGPIMLRFFTFLYSLSFDNIAVFILLWKISMIAAIVVSGYLVFKIIKQLNPNQSKSTFIFFWLTQPLFLFEVLTNGHFDIVWMIFVLWAFLASLKKQWWFVVPLLVVGIWIKFIPLLFSPFFALWWWQDTNKLNWQKNTRQIIAGIVLAVLVTVLSWGSLWQGPKVFASVIIQSKWAVISWFAVLYYSLKPMFLSLFQGNAHFILTRLVHAVVLSVFIYFIWPYLKKIYQVVFKKEVWQPAEYLQAIFICMLMYLFIWQKSMWPWYTVWLIPVGNILYSVTKNSFVKKIVIWISTVPFIFYSVWLFNWWFRGVDGGSELWFYYLMVLSVTGYPLFLIWKWRKTNYQLVELNVK